MAKTRWTLAWQAVLAVMFLMGADRCSAYGQAAGTGMTPAAQRDARVRAEDPALSTLIRQAIDQSTTFRNIVEAIRATDGIVYVVRGQCGHGVRACLFLWMAAAGPNRMLRIVVDGSRQADIETMASLGHELRHALEVLAEPSLRTGAGMFNFYRHSGAVQGVFETEAAIAAGDAVYLELKRHRKN